MTYLDLLCLDLESKIDDPTPSIFHCTVSGNSKTAGSKRGVRNFSEHAELLARLRVKLGQSTFALFACLDMQHCTDKAFSSK